MLIKYINRWFSNKTCIYNSQFENQNMKTNMLVIKYVSVTSCLEIKDTDSDIGRAISLRLNS